MAQFDLGTGRRIARMLRHFGAVASTLALLVGQGAQARNPGAHKSAAIAARPHFVDKTGDAALLKQIWANADRWPTLARGYYHAAAPCLQCRIDWFINRRTGATIAVPNEMRTGEMVRGLGTNVRSDVVTVVYGPIEGEDCSSRKYRLIADKLVPISRRIDIACPR